MQAPSLTQDDINLIASQRASGHGMLFKFIFANALISVVFLISVLKPHRIYKEYLGKFFNIEFTYNKAKWKIYNLLFLVIVFYLILFMFIKLQISQYKVHKMDNHATKMSKLDKKWLLESELWLTFLILCCLITIYRCAQLFTEESKLKDEIESINADINRIKLNQQEEVLGANPPEIIKNKK